MDVESLHVDDAETMIIAYGSVSRSAVSAVKIARNSGVKAGFLKLKIIWPFPDKVIMDACRMSKRVIVPEMNIGKISRECERLSTDDQEIIPMPKLGGDMHTPEEILNVIRSV